MKTRSPICHTTADLIRVLQTFPPETKLQVVSADLGGYDVSHQPFGFVYYSEQDQTISIDHGEYEAFQALTNKEITDAEFSKLYS